jgi:hypothetical protein
MIQKLKWGFAALALITSIAACTTDDSPSSVVGWKPIYEDDAHARPIKFAEPRATQKGGKIYVMGTTLYQVESGKGIHVLSFNNPSNPQKLAFIEVPGAQEISIKGSYLYTNNYNDLVVLDIAELTDVKVIKRMKDLFTFTTMDTPPLPGYFECVDPSKGRVVDWEQTTIYSPKCKL